ncbi:MAG: hypothetical protein DMF71_10000 [Acidobacteria bacterium]|nr:MAG: hypothetical protein DMF71_10000 [Acidobacteriota bacterium]
MLIPSLAQRPFRDKIGTYFKRMKTAAEPRSLLKKAFKSSCRTKPITMPERLMGDRPALRGL